MLIMETVVKFIALCGVLLQLLTMLTEGHAASVQLSLTNNQKLALQQFKNAVMPKIPIASAIQQYAQDDYFFYRWLHRYNLDVQLATQHFLEHLQWRKNRNIDTLDLENWSSFKADFPLTQDSFDKEGRPIVELWWSEWDVRGAMLSGQGIKLSRWLDNVFETVLKRIHKARVIQGKNVTQAVILGDVENTNIRHTCALCTQIYAHLGETWEKQYPDILHGFYVVNMNPGFDTVLKTMKPFLSQRTNDVVKSFMTKGRWKPFLDRIIAPSQRSWRFGGTCRRNIDNLS